MTPDAQKGPTHPEAGRADTDDLGLRAALALFFALFAVAMFGQGHVSSTVMRYLCGGAAALVVVLLLVRPMTLR